MNIGYICILKLLPNIPLNMFLLLEGTIIKKKLCHKSDDDNNHNNLYYSSYQCNDKCIIRKYASSNLGSNLAAYCREIETLY